MRKSLVAAGLLAFAAAQVSAQMVYEGFDYSAGSNLSSYNGSDNQGMLNPYGSTWQTAGSTASSDFIQVNPPTLTIGSVGGTGNSAQWGGQGDASRLPIGPFFAPSTGGNTLYYSAAIQVTNYDDLWENVDTGSTAAGLGNRGVVLGFNTVAPQQTGIPSVVGARLIIRKGSTPNTFQFGFSKNSNIAGQFVFGATDYPLLDSSNNPITYFVVGSYTLNGGGATNDDAAIWINPDASTFSSNPPTPTFSTVSLGTGQYQPESDGNDLSTGSIQSFLLLQRGVTTQSSGVVIDELRIDGNWSGVTPVPGTSYTGGVTGTWSDGGNWSGGSAPSAAGSTVNLPQQASPVTITLTSPQTVGTLNLSSSNGYTLNGSGTLTLSGSATINSTAGAHTISAPLSVATSLEVNLASAASVNITSDMTYSVGATLIKSGGGTLTVKNVRADALTIIGDGSALKIAPNGTNTGVSVIKSLSIPTITSSASGNPQLPPVSKLDLTDNTLVYDYTGTSPLTNQLPGGASPSVLNLITYGYDAGNWDGTGIVSSTAAADPRKVTAIGYAEASVLKGLSTGGTDTYAGQTVDDTTLILKVTKYGDINLDGVINGDDYAVLDRNFAKGTFASGNTAQWTDGDFNYDFQVTSADYLLIDTAYGVQQGVLSPALLAERQAEFGDAYVASLIAAVPEPTSLGIFASTLLSLAIRHRQRK